VQQNVFNRHKIEEGQVWRARMLLLVLSTLFYYGSWLKPLHSKAFNFSTSLSFCNKLSSKSSITQRTQHSCYDTCQTFHKSLPKSPRKKSPHTFHTREKSSLDKSLHNTKHKILNKTSFILGLGIKLCLMLHYSPFMWSHHDFSLMLSVSREPRVFVLHPTYFTYNFNFKISFWVGFELQ
jgi:hypothetical protein